MATLTSDDLQVLTLAATRVCDSQAKKRGPESIVYIRADQLQELGGTLPDGCKADAPSIEIRKHPSTGREYKARKVSTAPVTAGELLRLCQAYGKKAAKPNEPAKT